MLSTLVPRPAVPPDHTKIPSYPWPKLLTLTIVLAFLIAALAG